jgi:hypothetical protein
MFCTYNWSRVGWYNNIKAKLRSVQYFWSVKWMAYPFEPVGGIPGSCFHASSLWWLSVRQVHFGSVFQTRFQPYLLLSRAELAEINFLTSKFELVYCTIGAYCNMAPHKFRAIYSCRRKMPDMQKLAAQIHLHFLLRISQNLKLRA